MKLIVEAECTNHNPPTFEVSVTIDAGSKTSSTHDQHKVFRAVFDPTTKRIAVTYRGATLRTGNTASLNPAADAIKAVLSVMGDF